MPKAFLLVALHAASGIVAQLNAVHLHQRSAGHLSATICSISRCSPSLCSLSAGAALLSAAVHLPIAHFMLFVFVLNLLLPIAPF